MILPLESQVAPLALCRKLKELGAPQESLHQWYEGISGTMFVSNERDSYARWPQLCAAYTVAELGVLMPHASECPTVNGGAGRGHFRWEQSFMKDREGEWWHNEGPQSLCDRGCSGHESEAEARAILLIALTEAGIMRFATEEPKRP
jgi:hypothetical protein